LGKLAQKLSLKLDPVSNYFQNWNFHANKRYNVKHVCMLTFLDLVIP